MLLAQAHHAEGNLGKARSLYSKVANDAPRLLVGNEFGAAGFIQQILKLLLTETREMLSVTPDSFEIDSGNAWSFVARGELYQLAGQNDRALTDFDRAVELNPNCLQLYKLRAGILAKSGMCDLAIADYTKAIELNHSNY